MPAEIRRHRRRNRNFTESVMAAFGRNRKYAVSTIYTFGAETEIRSIFTSASYVLELVAVFIRRLSHVSQVKTQPTRVIVRAS